MKRKDFFKWTAAFISGLALTRQVKAIDFKHLLEGASTEGEEHFWKLVRDQFILDPGWTYLNFGGLGASPLPVLNSLLEWTQSEERAPNAGHDDKEWWSVKERLARILGKTCRKEDLALISTATEGINMIINGLPLKRGDEVITSTH